MDGALTRFLSFCSSVEVYKLMDRVEVFHGSVWRRGWVRVLLTGQCYKVCFVATEEEHVFRHSHVRRLKVWEDGAWHDGPPKVISISVSTFCQFWLTEAVI